MPWLKGPLPINLVSRRLAIKIMASRDVLQRSSRRATRLAYELQGRRTGGHVSNLVSTNRLDYEPSLLKWTSFYTLKRQSMKSDAEHSEKTG